MLAAAAPTARLQANYSRDLEREADAYAIEVLRLNGISPEHLAVALERLDRSAGGATDAGGPLPISRAIRSRASASLRRADRSAPAWRFPDASDQFRNPAPGRPRAMPRNRVPSCVKQDGTVHALGGRNGWQR